MTLCLPFPNNLKVLHATNSACFEEIYNHVNMKCYMNLSVTCDVFFFPCTRNYFKFMFVRHPPERVLSAYRNKIEHPLITNPAEQSIWDDVRHIILSSYRMKFNKKLAKQEEIFPSFAEFIHFLYDSDPALMNEHYKPMVELCQPCAVKYDYIGNFATLRRDANNILAYLNINSSFFWDRGKHKSNPTISHVQQYYSKLQAIDFRRLEERFADDIGFYNHLFPLEYDGEYSELRKLS